MKEANEILVGVAEGPRPQDARREAGVREAPCRHPPYRPGVGAERSGREPLELPELDLGRRRMEQVAGVGLGLRSGAGRKDRRDDPGAPLGNRQCDHPPRHQRTGRRHQQPDQDREGPQPRLSQPGMLRERSSVLLALQESKEPVHDTWNVAQFTLPNSQYLPPLRFQQQRIPSLSYPCSRQFGLPIL